MITYRYIVHIRITVSGEKYIGSFTNYYHDIAGKVFAVDDQTLRIEGFKYDGEGPDAFFVVGTNADNPGEGDTVRSIYSDALGKGQKMSLTILPHPFVGQFYDFEDKSTPILEGKFEGVSIDRIF